MKKFSVAVIGSNCITKRLEAQLKQAGSRKLPIACHLFSEASTFSAEQIIEADNVDIVIVCEEQVMQAYEMSRKALELGKHVVINNVTMLAAHGEKLWRLAVDKNLHLRFEAVALGAAPIFESLSNHFKGQEIKHIYGTLSSTCNYALMRMKDKGDNLTDALSDAIELGYAEKDPNIDLSGKNSLYKIALMHSLAYGNWPDVSKQSIQGLEGLEPVDIQLCQKMARNIKLLASTDGEKLSVSPTLFEEYSQLGNTTGTLSGVVVESTEAGPVFMCGHSADSESIASALISDCLKIANGQKPWALGESDTKQEKAEKRSQYYIRVLEKDSEAILKANHIHIVDEQHVQNSQGLHMAYIVETGMPKNELKSFLTHQNFEGGFYFMNVFKDD